MIIGLIMMPLAAIVAAMGVWISTLAAFIMGIATLMVTGIAAFIAFLLVVI
ncbi:MAG: hypothetical protein ACUVTR_02810 [Dehalococcoidia bacterium]